MYWWYWYWYKRVCCGCIRLEERKRRVIDRFRYLLIIKKLWPLLFEYSKRCNIIALTFLFLIICRDTRTDEKLAYYMSYEPII